MRKLLNLFPICYLLRSTSVPGHLLPSLLLFNLYIFRARFLEMKSKKTKQRCLTIGPVSKDSEETQSDSRQTSENNILSKFLIEMFSFHLGRKFFYHPQMIIESNHFQSHLLPTFQSPSVDSFRTVTFDRNALGILPFNLQLGREPGGREKG